MPEHVYFIACDGRIKIGTSKNAEQRIAALRTLYHEPLVFLGCAPGGREFEQRVQREFEKFRTKGEWFRDCPELRAGISQHLLAATFPPAPPAPKVRDAKAFGRVVLALWPDDPAANLAKRAGCTKRAAHFYIRGKRKPSARVLIAIMRELV